MKLFNVIQRLFYDKLGKRDITDRIRVIIQKYDEVVLPLIPKLEQQFGNESEPASDYVKGFLKEFRATLPSSLRNSKKNPYFAVAHRSLTNARELLVLLEANVSKELPEIMYIEGITYQKATLLRLIELLDFTVDYASRQFCYYTANEVNVSSFFHGAESIPFTKSEEAAVRSNQSSFFKVLELFYQKPKDVMGSISRIPEVLITGNEKIDLPAASTKEIDPLQLGIIPIVSPIWQFVGEKRVDWEAARYERTKQERRDVEMRMEILKQKNAGKVDARTESILNGYARELTLLRDRIETFERKVR